MTTVTWNSVTLPGAALQGIKKSYQLVGSGERMGDGTLRTDVVDHKWRVEISWVMVSATDRTTLRTQYDANRTGSHTLAVGSDSWTVAAALNGYVEDEIYVGSGGSRYNVKIVFEEV